MLPVHGGENARKPFPLSSNEALEASTTVKQRSVEVEDHRLYIRQHQVYKTLIRDLPNGARVSRRLNARILPQQRKAGGSTRLLGSPSSATLPGMTIKARVHGGRLVVDEPTTLPEGTEVELLPLDPGDWLDEADRVALHAALGESEADIVAGRLVDASEVLKGLRGD